MSQAKLKQAETVRNAEEAKKLPSADHANREDGHEHEHALNWREINRVLFVAGAAVAIWVLGGARNPYITGIGVICTIVGGFAIFHEAYDLAKENLSYYDHVLGINRDRYNQGKIAQVDLDRLELQRMQYESDLQTADVNLRTAKIQLLALLNDQTPVEQFDVIGPFDFSNQIAPLDDVRQKALDTQPDLKAALQSVDMAKTDHRLAVSNGSTDPTFGFDVGRNPPIDQYIGISVNIPLRIFDRNQGEKPRTQLGIDRNGKLLDATRVQVFSDVDSAYASVNSAVILLQPYKNRYLKQAVRVRDTIEFSYERGAASLLDFLNAQTDYRTVEVNYLNLVASYLDAANQLNLAVGREVIP